MTMDEYDGSRIELAVDELSGRPQLNFDDLQRIREKYDLTDLELGEVERQVRGGLSAVDAARPRRSEREDDEPGLRLFFKRVADYPLLTADEEGELARAIEAGVAADMQVAAAGPSADLRRLSQRGRQAKERFINSNLRLVVHVAQTYQGRGLALEDLIQVGTIGLNRAVEKFDWRLGNKFSTYAVPWIHQTIQREIDNTARMIRLPVHVAVDLRRLKSALFRVARRGGSERDISAIAQLGQFEEQEVEALLRVMRDAGSLDAPAGQGGASIGSLLPAALPDALEEAMRGDARTRVRTALARLTARERRVVELRFGLVDDRVRTLEEIGRELNVTRERIRQIEGQALDKLEIAFRKEGLGDYA